MDDNTVHRRVMCLHNDSPNDQRNTEKNGSFTSAHDLQIFSPEQQWSGERSTLPILAKKLQP